MVCIRAVITICGFHINCHIFILRLIKQLLITSGSNKAMSLWSFADIMKLAGVSSLIFPEVQLQPADAAVEGVYLRADSSSLNRVMMSQHDLNPWNDTVSQASGCMLGSCKRCVNVWHHITEWLWLLRAYNEVINSSESSVEKQQ